MNHILRILALAITLFLCVGPGFSLVNLFYSGQSSSGSAIQVPVYLLLIIFASEVLRAIPTYWLYVHHSGHKKQVGHSILFGLVCCFLIGSLYIFLAPFELPIQNKQRYVINGVVIFSIQGIASGYVLWLMFFKFRQAAIN